MADVPPILDVLKEKDPEFLDLVKRIMALATSEKVLNAKTKTLISLALDAAGGYADGVKAISDRAHKMGISDKEIAETIRLAFLVGGFPGLVTGLNAFKKE